MFHALNEHETRREDWNEREMRLIEAGCSVLTYSELLHNSETGRNEWTEDEYYFQIDPVAYSDYSGSAVDIANTRYMRNTAPYAEFMECRAGGYGTDWTVVSQANINYMDEDTFEELINDIDYIVHKYPILDESEWSEVEMELAEENYYSWAESDYIREIFMILHNTEGYEDIAQLWDDNVFDGVGMLFYRAVGETGEYWENDGGSSMHINVDKLAAWTVENDINSIIKRISEETSK